MAMTNAQRQAAFRARHLKDTEGTAQRINLLVDTHTKQALERLAHHYAVTQQVMIQRLVCEAESALVNALDGAAQTVYYEKQG